MEIAKFNPPGILGIYKVKHFAEVSQSFLMMVIKDCVSSMQEQIYQFN